MRVAKFPAPTDRWNSAKRIQTKIETYAETPAAQVKKVKALQGRNGIHLWVGERRG